MFFFPVICNMRQLDSITFQYIFISLQTPSFFTNLLSSVCHSGPEELNPVVLLM